MGYPRPALHCCRGWLLPILTVCFVFGVQNAFAQPPAGSVELNSRTRSAAPAADLVQPVLVDSSTQTAPAIDGRRVVWQDERFGAADIFLADLDTGTIHNLTNNKTSFLVSDVPSAQINPAVGDGVVV